MNSIIGSDRRLKHLFALLFFCGFFLFADGEKEKVYREVGEIERELLRLVNQERKERMLPVLADHIVLGEVSLQHSQKMAAENTLSHDFPGYKSLDERLKEAGLFFIRGGENVAFSHPYMPEVIHQGFMDSPAHRDNILDPHYTHCSIRVVFKSTNLYITEEFAELFSPLPRDEIASLLREYLGTWYKKKFGYPLIFFPSPAEVRDYAEFCARQNLLGRQVKTVNKKWGSFYVVGLVSPELDKLKKGLIKQVKKIGFQSAEIGVTFGKHYDFPGGTYAVSALLFPGNKYRDISDERLSRYILKALNKLRAANSRQAFNYSKTLSDEAVKLARLYYEQPDNSLAAPRDRQVLVYQTYDPKEIPSRFEDFLLNRKRGGRAGISVYCPLRHGLPGGFFIVAIVIADILSGSLH